MTPGTTGPEAVAPVDVAAMIARSALSRILALATGGFDVVIGTVKAPGAAKGFYVALEHLELDEPEEFQGGNIETALAAASAWAAGRGYPTVADLGPGT